MRRRPHQRVIEVCAPGVDRTVSLSVLPSALTSSKTRDVESASHGKGRKVTPGQPSIAIFNGDMRVAGYTGSTKSAPLGDPHQLTPWEQKEWETWGLPQEQS